MAVFEQRRRPTTLIITHIQCSAEFAPDSLTTIHTLAYLALVTHMKTGWINNPQVDLMTLKLSAHTCPKRFYKDTPTEFKSLQLPSS